MNLVIDTSIIISVLVNEKHKEKLIDITRDANLIAPSSVHWEIGNAFSAMFKRKQITLKQAKSLLNDYKRIPIRFSDVELDKSLDLAKSSGLYAYDAYVIICALKHNCPLVSLDKGLIRAASKSGATILEVK